MNRARWQPLLPAYPGWRALLVDGTVALLLTGFSIGASHWMGRFGGQPGAHHVDAAGMALLVIAPLATSLRRVWPAGILVVVVAATAAYLALGYPYGPTLLSPALAAYAVGSRVPLPQSAAIVLGALALYLPGALVPTPMPAWLGTVANQVGWYLLLLLLPWAVGVYVRAGREGRTRKREEELRQRAYQERLEIAREVHDVVGHGLAVINMQAGVALHVVDRRPEQARVALEAIRQASGDALEELRRTLAVFRQQEPGGARRPAPGLDQLGGLVEAMAEGGLAVDLEVRGDRPPTTAAVELAAYRIVQESLTNVLRHAAATRARVRVTFAGGWMDLDIVDDGRGRAGQPTAGGHGIAGMRERASALGGEFEAGPAPGRGFGVHARLPLTEDNR